MKMTVLVETAKGFFAEQTVEVTHIQAGLNKVLKVLETIPDEIDGVNAFEWTKTTITFEV